MKGSLKTRYDLDKMAAAATVSVNAGDIKLRATMTDATVVKGPSLNGLALALEKPGAFIVDYNVPNKVLLACFPHFLPFQLIKIELMFSFNFLGF